MIIKGRSCAGPRQLAARLLDTDDGWRAEVLELHSGLDDLAATLRDWQTLSEGTLGSKGLYHAFLAPHPGIALTPAQCFRAADILEQELRLMEQPRAVVVRTRADRQLVHAVWCRTDLDTMTLKPDSFSYRAHMRASARIISELGAELGAEFGFVPVRSADDIPATNEEPADDCEGQEPRCAE